MSESHKWNEVESIFFELFSPEVNICEQNVNIREQTFLVTMKIVSNFAASNLILPPFITE